MRLKKDKIIDPALEEAFVSGAKADKAESALPLDSLEETDTPSPAAISSEEPVFPLDPHQLVRRTEWPILPSLEPSMAEGRSDLDKGFVMRMKEDFWNSVDRHCKALGVDKSKWIRQAISNQMAAEQAHFVNLQKGTSSSIS